jgi:hypothetical protein
MISDWFYEGGFMMYVVLLAGLIAIPLAIVHAAQPKRWSLAISGGFLVLVLASGAAGTLLGRMKVNQVLPLVAPDQVEALKEQGYKEASRPIVFAAIVVGIGAIPFAFGEIKRKK